MAKLTVEIPDALISQVNLRGYSLEAVLSEALTSFLSSPQNIIHTRTWQLCGNFTINTHSDSSNLEEITNYAEQIDDVIYQEF
jgi:hypothetical protein